MNSFLPVTMNPPTVQSEEGSGEGPEPAAFCAAPSAEAPYLCPTLQVGVGKHFTFCSTEMASAALVRKYHINSGPLCLSESLHSEYKYKPNKRSLSI